MNVLWICLWTFNKLLLLNKNISVHRLSESNKNKKNIVPWVYYLYLDINKYVEGPMHYFDTNNVR